MSHYGIPVDRSCGSYRPGHQVHWIHAKKASEKDQPLITVSLTIRGYGWVDIDGDDFTLKLWSHSATRLRRGVGPLRTRRLETPMAHAQPAGSFRFRPQHGHLGPANTVH